MTDLVDPAEIEAIVSAPRHQTLHLGRFDSARGAVFILHSAECLAAGEDLRFCRFSIALDEGVDDLLWRGWRNQPVVLAVLMDGYLTPATEAPTIRAGKSNP